jgi:hypothetical protein
MNTLDVYHVALDCSINNFNKSPKDIIFGTYGDMGQYIGTNVPVVFTLDDAHQTGIKLINHVLKYGPLCKKTDTLGNVYMFPVRGYIIVKYIYNGPTYNFIYQNELKDNYSILSNIINNNNLVLFTINGIQRGIINRNYFNNNMSNPHIYVVDGPRITGIYNYMQQNGPSQVSLLESYPRIPIPITYHHMNHHNKHKKKHKNIDSSSFSPKKRRYKKYKMIGGDNDDIDDFDNLYEDKYLKYKEKYLNLKNI